MQRSVLISERAAPTSNSETRRNKKKETQARAVRTRLLGRGRSVPTIYLAQSCGNGPDSDVLLLHRAPKYRLVVVRQAFKSNILNLMNWFTGLNM